MAAFGTKNVHSAFGPDSEEEKKSIDQIQNFFLQAHDQQRDLHHMQKQLGKAAQECEELSQHSGFYYIKKF